MVKIHHQQSSKKQPAWLTESEGFLIDLDGTLIRGGRVTDGSIRLLNSVRDRFVVTSNNSTDVTSGLQRKLRHMGIVLSREQLVLAGEETVRWLASNRPRRRIQCLGSTQMRRFARSLDLVISDADPDIVLLARDRSFSYRRLASAANHLRAGAELVVTNIDTTHPADDSHGVVPETGALLAALRAASAAEPVRITGKPEPHLWIEGLRRLGTEPEKTLVIGDNPRTDALGASRLGMRCMLVGIDAEATASSPGALLDHAHFFSEARDHVNTA